MKAPKPFWMAVPHDGNTICCWNIGFGTKARCQEYIDAIGKRDKRRAVLFVPVIPKRRKKRFYCQCGTTCIHYKHCKTTLEATRKCGRSNQLLGDLPNPKRHHQLRDGR